MKTCSKCFVELLEDTFYKQKNQVAGLHPWCKKCCREYRLVNIEQERVRQRVWYYKNHKKRLAQNKASQIRNRNKTREQRKKFTLENRELLANRWKEWAKNNQSHIKAKKAMRKAREAKNGGSFTRDEWDNLKEVYNNSCLMCGKPEPSIHLVPDHVVPLAKGGSSFISNIQPLCRYCNGSKYTKIIDYRKQVLA